VRRTGRSSPLAGRRLPSADWIHGPSPKLPPLASLAVVKQSATVSSRSVLTHAGHESSQLRRPALIGAPRPPPRAFVPPPCSFGGDKRTNEGRACSRPHARRSLQSFPPNKSCGCFAVGEGMGWGRFLRRRRRSALGMARASALRELTHRHCLTTASEASGGSLPMHPQSRACPWSRPARADRRGMSPQPIPSPTATRGRVKPERHSNAACIPRRPGRTSSPCDPRNTTARRSCR